MRLASTSCSAFLAVSAIGLACSSPNATGAGGAGPGSGGAIAANTNGSGPNSTHTVAASSSKSGGQQGAGGSSFVCNPPAEAGSIYEKQAVSFALDDISMCQYRGEVLLIIDTAAA